MRHAPLRNAPTVLSLVGAVAAVILIVRAVRNALRPQGSDFTVYWQAAEALLRGESPYEAAIYFPYFYPPFLAWTLQPLTALPEVLVASVWGVALVAALVWSVKVLRGEVVGAAREAGVERHRWDPLVFVLLLLPLYRVVHSNIVNGQVNLIMLAECAAFFAAWRRGRWLLAGLFLALAVHTKVAPGILVFFLALHGSWRALGWATVFGALMLAVPLLQYDPAFYTHVLQGFLDGIEHTTGEGAHSYHTAPEGHVFFTLHGLAAWIHPAWDTSRTVRVVSGVIVVASAISAHAWLRRRPTALSPAAAFAVYLSAINLVAPWSQKHHLAMTLPCVVIAALAIPRTRATTRILGIALFTLTAAAMLLAKPFPTGPFYFAFIVAAWAAAIWAGRSVGIPATGAVGRTG